MSEAEPAEDFVAQLASPGRALAAARADLKLSVADVSQQIKYGVKQIAAIEADDYAKLPGTTFVRGMIRSYAKLVQLDPQPLLADLGRRDIPAPVTVDLRTSEQEPFVEGGKKSNRVYGYLSLVALLVVAVVVYEWYASPPSTGEVVTITPKVVKSEPVQGPLAQASVPEQQQGVTDTPAIEPPAPGQTQTTAPPSAAAVSGGRQEASKAGAKRLELEFGEVSWVEIRQANGKILLSQLNPAGSRQSIEGMPPFDVVIGNAAKVKLKYDDAPVDLRPYFKVDVARLTLE